MSYAPIPGLIPQKVDAVGRWDKSDHKWDDGSEYDGVTKIYVRIINFGIQFIKFDYVKGGEVKPALNVFGPYRYTHEIVINHPEEYLVSVRVWCDLSEVIQRIQFITNKKDHEVMGKNHVYSEDSLEVKDKKIIGFHGNSNLEGYLTSVGAYFVPKVLEAGWDDGKHEKVKKVQVTYDEEAIYSIQATYDGTALPSQLHGTVGPKSDEFTLESDEYITGLSAYGKTLSSHSQDVITALTFTTNKSTYGFYAHKTSFKVSAPTGNQIAGFLGRSGFLLNSIDAHFTPVPEQKIVEARETEWDDRSDHDGVTKIHVRSGASGIQLIKFDYVKDGQTKEGAIHGSKGSGKSSTREIVIDHPDEYLVSVKGWSDSSNVIVGIQFETNTKKYDPMGYDIDNDDIPFYLHRQGQKIVGFYGSSGTHVSTLQAHFTPIIAKITAVKIPAVGGVGGTPWDDGTFDSVRAVYVGSGQDGIAMVKFEYHKEGQVEPPVGEHGKRTTQRVRVFKLDYPSEYLTEVEGTYDKIVARETEVITMLRFKTNKRTSEPFGLEAGHHKDTRTISTLKMEGHKIVGFHGSTTHDESMGHVLHNIGVYVLPLTN